MNKLFISRFASLCTRNLNNYAKDGVNVLPNIFSLKKVTNTVSLHTTTWNRDLMEFFDDEKNWGKEEIKLGRSWKKDELRIKSNEDLHKLWYVLLKEKNMLLTMEHECEEQIYLFPNPERIDKVQESMKNLEDVIRERNRAYYMLETGEDGEQPGKVVHDQIGRIYVYHKAQHPIPKFMNRAWRKNHIFHYDYKEVASFMRLYKEKHKGLHHMRKMKRRKYVTGLLKRFENIDKDYLQEKYPEFNIKELEDEAASKGHRIPSLMK